MSFAEPKLDFLRENLESSPPKNGRSRIPMLIPLSSDVCIRHVIIEGVRYISYLRNSSRSAAEPAEELLLNAQVARTIRSIIIGDDDPGIRQALFSSSRHCIVQA
jgi:hypothetical protein